MNDFDFDVRKCKPTYGSFHDPSNNDEKNKKLMLDGLQNFCMCCRFCKIGCKLVSSGRDYDPHVFSNMIFNSRFMIIRHSPTIDDFKIGTPFMNQYGKKFDMELKKHGMDRTNFYVTSLIKCFSQKHSEEFKNCETFLNNEIKIIKPKLLITTDKKTFKILCPESKYGASKITKSKYGNIYSINQNCGKFSRQIELLCKLIKKIK